MDSYGCGGVRGTGEQENKTNRGTDGRAQDMFDTLWTGKFPQKYVWSGIEGVRIGAAVAAAAENSDSSRN